MIFTELITDLQNELKRELAQIRFLIKKKFITQIINDMPGGR